MGEKLNEAIQQSYVEGMQMSLAEMNEEDYYLIDVFTGEQIKYGEPFFLFRGRVFASYENWENWLLTNSELQLEQQGLKIDKDEYNMLWDKYKRTRVKSLTKQ